MWASRVKSFPPRKIIEFLELNHVVSLALVCPNGVLWAASCFYVYDHDKVALIILSDDKSRHAKAMHFHSYIAGTISGQTKDIRKIQGIQFMATAKHLESKSDYGARRLYYKKFPLARVIPSEVWILHFEELKFTDNTLFFAEKTLWSSGNAVSLEKDINYENTENYYRH